MNPRFICSGLRAAGAIAAALTLCGCPNKKDAAAGAAKPGIPPAPVHVATVVKKDMPFDVRTFGNVEPVATVAIKAQVGGDLIEVNFEEGQDVKKGQLLFSIQPRLFATQLAQAKANLERDTALAENAVLNLKRQEALDAKGSGVKEELEKARALAASTAATVKADEALVLIAETQLGYATIESPMDGRAGSVRLRPGNLIKAGDELPLTTIVQMAPIYVAFAVPEKHLTAIRREMDAGRTLAVTVSDPTDGRKLADGKVAFIANTVDTATGTITLKAGFDNTDRALWPGAFVDVSLRLSIDHDAVVVPSSAVNVSQHGPMVYVVKDETAEMRRVSVVRTAGLESIISSGISVGEAVISSGQSRVLPGGKLIIKPASGAAPAPAGNPADKPAENPSAPAGKPSAAP